MAKYIIKRVAMGIFSIFIVATVTFFVMNLVHLEFICGTGMLLPKFEEAILGKEPGEKVAFTLSPKDGYGEVIAEAIVDLPKNTFMVDGKLAEDILFAGSQVPMSDAQGNRMIGTIKEVGEETVKMDFNHPMAGKTLNFEVEVVSVRDVTPEDLQSADRKSTRLNSSHNA